MYEVFIGVYWKGVFSSKQLLRSPKCLTSREVSIGDFLYYLISVEVKYHCWYNTYAADHKGALHVLQTQIDC